MNILSLTDVGITLGDRPLFEHVTLGIDAGEKIGFVGRAHIISELPAPTALR